MLEMVPAHDVRHRMTAANRRRQLLEIGLDVFSRRGFSGATTKEIADMAGVSEAAIFRHFPSKEALYSAVLDLRGTSNEEQQWLKDLKRHMECNNDEAVVRSFAKHILQFYQHDTRFERVILFAALESHRLGLARIHELGSPIVQLMSDYIARRQRQGVLIQYDPRTVVLALGGMVHHYGLLTEIFGAPFPKTSEEDITNAFCEIILHGIRRSASARQNGRRKARLKK
jgi:TetR/AcrR family transcriptional regulator